MAYWQRQEIIKVLSVSSIPFFLFYPLLLEICTKQAIFDMQIIRQTAGAKFAPQTYRGWAVLLLSGIILQNRHFQKR